ncbi:hypothetical protein [Parasitella parasitica]|uniref:Uncharacterized protein n=1 Tax=Parasitella parasitica TaxID=35722 RepID=A0A0B7NIJ7_9FUNG|nr:hypothetical protein [Parasitella parasitica]
MNKQPAEHDFHFQWQLYPAPERNLLLDKISLPEVDNQDRNEIEAFREDKFSKSALFTPEICDRLNQRQVSSIVKAFSAGINAVKTKSRDGKGRGRNGRSQSSTQRDPSASEHANQRTGFEESQEPTQGKCGRCSLVGHNIRTCNVLRSQPQKKEESSQQQQRRQQQQSPCRRKRDLFEDSSTIMGSRMLRGQKACAYYLQRCSLDLLY